MAVKSKATLQSDIATVYADNTSGAITPAVLRAQQVDVTDSVILNPMTTSGDIIVGGASGAPGRLGVGGLGSALVATPTGPDWGHPVYDIEIPTHIWNRANATTGGAGTGAGAGVTWNYFVGLGDAPMSAYTGTVSPSGGYCYWRGNQVTGSNRYVQALGSLSYARWTTRFLLSALSDGTNTFRVWIGWLEINSAAVTTAPLKALGMVIDGNTARTVDRTMAGVETLSTGISTIAANTAYELDLRYDGTNCEAFINGVSLGSITVVTRCALAPSLIIIQSSGTTARTLYHNFGLCTARIDPALL